MLKIKFWQLWWACMAALAASYPISASAADRIIDAGALPALLLLSLLPSKTRGNHGHQTNIIEDVFI